MHLSLCAFNYSFKCFYYYFVFIYLLGLLQLGTWIARLSLGGHWRMGDQHYSVAISCLWEIVLALQAILRIWYCSSVCKRAYLHWWPGRSTRSIAGFHLSGIHFPFGFEDNVFYPWCFLGWMLLLFGRNSTSANLVVRCPIIYYEFGDLSEVAKPCSAEAIVKLSPVSSRF